MIALQFLVQLLVKAGVSRQLALQLAQAYLQAHGMFVDPARAVEQILEELTRSGGSSLFSVGGASVTADAPSVIPGGLTPAPQSTQQLADLLAGLAGASRGTVSEQSLNSYGLSVTQAAGAVAYALGTQTGQTTNLDASTYDTLSSLGLLDDVSLDR